MVRIRRSARGARIGTTAVVATAALLVATACAPTRDGQAGTHVPDTQTVHALEIPSSENDPLRPQQWALDRTSFESAWSVSTGKGVTVAVIDSGVDVSHPELRGSVLPGKDYVDPADKGWIDPNGHGTLVAGIIAAHVNNKLGIVGAAPGVKILPVRVLNQKGIGSESNVAKGVIWAVDHGARVINLSLGGKKSARLEQALKYANRKGAVVVAAGGNDGQSGDKPVYPAAYPDVIAVAAVNADLSHPPFGSTGNYLDLSAPGVGIVSLSGASSDAYTDASGTSMATPFASAEAALIISAKPSLSPERVKQIMQSTATNPESKGLDPVFGHGLINPGAALYAVQPHPVGYATLGQGYWLVNAEGQVRPYGQAAFHGDLSGRHLTAPIVASARTPDGGGYWLAAADGSVFAFGDAHSYGSMAGHPLSSPIVGISATPSGHGYMLLGADGGVFTFGDAHFYGSTGNLRLAAPVISMTSAASGHGYWAVASDGGIFAFNVPFEGSMPAVRALTNGPVASTVRMRALPSGKGYYLLGSNGTVYAFGTAKFFGSDPGFAAVDLMLAP